MPIRDPDTGRELSGAARRKLRALRDAPDAPAKKPAAKKRPARKPAKKDPEPEACAENSAAQEDPGPNPFLQLADPPIENTAQLITWGAKVHALAVAHIAKNPDIYPNRREWIRALLGGTTQLGVIRDKAMEQSRIDAALRREEQEGKRQGLVDVRGRKAPPTTRPTR